MLDYLFTGGQVLDFESNELRFIHLGIQDGKIRYLGEEKPAAKKVLELEGKIISPGFVDIHMHEEELAVTGGDYDIALAMLSMGVTTAVGGNCGNNRQSIKEFIDHVDQKGSPVNYMSFVGHNSLRQRVGNNNTKRASTEEEIQQMKALLVEDLKLGAVGLSFGFEYATGATLEEVLALTEPFWGRKTHLLSAHYRYDADRSLEAIEEMVQIAKKTEIPFLISHLSSCSAFGMMEETLTMIRNYIKDGVDLAVDAYPYAAFSTLIGSDVFEDGCLERWGVDYDAIELTEAPYENMRCTKEIFYDARENYPEMIAIAHVMREEDIGIALADPLVMVASDGLYRHHKGHPRGAGTFPRFIGRYLRDQKIMDFVEGMKKITLMPAERLGLENKGRIALGMDADLTIFSLEEIMDQAVFGDGQRPPKGIDYVFLDGVMVLEKGKILRQDKGKFIRKDF